MSLTTTFTKGNDMDEEKNRYGKEKRDGRDGKKEQL